MLTVIIYYLQLLQKPGKINENHETNQSPLALRSVRSLQRDAAQRAPHLTSLSVRHHNGCPRASVAILVRHRLHLSVHSTVVAFSNHFPRRLQRRHLATIQACLNIGWPGRCPIFTYPGRLYRRLIVACLFLISVEKE